jgi:uroporphyrin-III C-methyltransferase/precorrin-2 dehydrogenase/sirohydrochlorin ferrochelatase
MTGARVPEPVPPRIAPLPSLPLFHKIEGKKAVVAGGSPGALWKAELLSAAGARVLVLAGHPTAAKLFEDLVARPINGPVKVLARRWRARDLAGAVLAVGDLAGEGEAEAFAAAARAAGAPVNLIDRTADCDVQFGTIVNRAPLVLAISTDGAAPMLGQSIRARIEAMLPRGLSAWAEAAKSWRPRVKSRLERFADRRAFWAAFVGRAWAGAERAPEEADFEALLAGTPERRGGSVTLVGAGPGDPELLTMKAVRALQTATIILHDDLVAPEILDLARREAVRIAVGKRGHGPSVRQSEIDSRLVALAQAGETVVAPEGRRPADLRPRDRGDRGMPRRRHRGRDHSRYQRRAGRRRRARLLADRAQGRPPDPVRYRPRRRRRAARRSRLGSVADPAATTIVYMPRATMSQFAAAAIAAGLDPATPALAVANATRADQNHVAASLASIAGLAEGLPAGAPVILIVGQVARSATEAVKLLRAA